MKITRPTPPAVVVLALVALGVLLRLVLSLPAVRAASDDISFFAFLWVFFWLGWHWRDRKCGLCWRPGPELRFSATQSSHACSRHHDEIREWWEDQQRQQKPADPIQTRINQWTIIRGDGETGA